jgi:glutamate synthase (NADPH/NADH) small chain
MGAGRRAARSMKTFLNIRDTDKIYRPQESGSAGRLFGIDAAERNFARVRTVPTARHDPQTKRHSAPSRAATQ